MISLLLLNNFYPVTSYRRVQEESDELSYTVTRYGPRSVSQRISYTRNKCPRG